MLNVTNERVNYKKDQTSILKATPSGGILYRFVKRIFDLVVSLAAGTVLILPLTVICVLVRMDSPGPALFSQKRLGKDGKVFKIYKIRTMKKDAPPNVATNDLEDIDQITTGIGRFLRKTSLDELPQLWNVIRGDMSIVGYRPVCLSEEWLNSQRLERGVLQVRPGITGYAQVLGRDDICASEKVALDVYYVQNRSLKLDMWCLLHTVGVVFTGEGAK